MRILVTSGGTEEPVDGVRRLTNLSTGRTGVVLARRFAAAGHQVLLLRAARAADSGDVPGLQTESFVSFADLEAALRRRLGDEEWDAVVHLAAVGDYHVAAVTVDGRDFPPGGPGKIGTGREVVLTLKPNPKLLESLKAWSRRPDITVIGFKLTDEDEPAAREAQVKRLFERGGVDKVVHNDLGGIGESRHEAAIYDEQGVRLKTGTKEELADALMDILEGDRR